MDTTTSTSATATPLPTSAGLHVLSLVVVSGAHEDCLDEQRPVGARYTRDTLRSLLQVLGCKPRLAYKIMQTIFAAVEVAVASSRQQRTSRRTFQVHPPAGTRVHVSLTRADFNELLSASAAQYCYKISPGSDELKVACGLRERRRCIIVLLCGTSGSGKSTLASILAARLGITTVVSTDSIRHMLRSFQPPQEAPLLWASTYEAGEALPPAARESLSPHEATIAGYKAQCQLLMAQLDQLVAGCEARCESLICEGVHLSISYVMKLAARRPSVLPFLVYIKNEAKHKERMAVRAKYMTLDPHMNKYVRYMGNIRWIQDYLVRKADKHAVPAVENTNIDRSVGVIHLTIMGCLRRMIRGEPVVEPGTRVARMLCAEYSSVLEQLQSASLAGLGAAAGAASSSAPSVSLLQEGRLPVPPGAAAVDGGAGAWAAGPTTTSAPTPAPAEAPGAAAGALPAVLPRPHGGRAARGSMDVSPSVAAALAAAVAGPFGPPLDTPQPPPAAAAVAETETGCEGDVADSAAHYVSTLRLSDGPEGHGTGLDISSSPYVQRGEAAATMEQQQQQQQQEAAAGVCLCEAEPPASTGPQDQQQPQVGVLNPATPICSVPLHHVNQAAAPLAEPDCTGHPSAGDTAACSSSNQIVSPAVCTTSITGAPAGTTTNTTTSSSSSSMGRGLQRPHASKPIPLAAALANKLLRGTCSSSGVAQAAAGVTGGLGSSPGGSSSNHSSPGMQWEGLGAASRWSPQEASLFGPAAAGGVCVRSAAPDHSVAVPTAQPLPAATAAEGCLAVGSPAAADGAGSSPATCTTCGLLQRTLSAGTRADVSDEQQQQQQQEEEEQGVSREEAASTQRNRRGGGSAFARPGATAPVVAALLDASAGAGGNTAAAAGNSSTSSSRSKSTDGRQFVQDVTPPVVAAAVAGPPFVAAASGQHLSAIPELCAPDPATLGGGLELGAEQPAAVHPPSVGGAPGDAWPPQQQQQQPQQRGQQVEAEDGEDGYLSSGDDLGPAEVGHPGSNSDGERFLQEYGSMYETTTADEHDDDDGPGLRAWNAGMARALWPARSSSSGGGGGSNNATATRGGAWSTYAPLSRSRQSSLNHRVQGVLQATTLSGHGAAGGAANAGAATATAVAAAASPAEGAAAAAAATAGDGAASASSADGDAGASPSAAK